MDLRDALKNTERGIKPIVPKVTDEDYFVPQGTEKELCGAQLTIQNIKDFGEMGNRNYLFTGPPGTGKTLGVMYLATQVGGLVYDGKIVNDEESIRQTFAQLRKIAKKEQKPIFLVVNEVDKFASRDSIIDPMQQKCLNTLLDEMQGFDKNDGIYVIGTTNKPDSLDIALRRTGRFSKEIEFMPPDKNGRLKILEIHANKKNHNFKITKEQLETVAQKTFGYTGADLCGLLNETFVESLRQGRKKTGQSIQVEDSDLEYGCSKTKPSALRDMPFREPSTKLNDLAGYDVHKALLKNIFEKDTGTTLLFYGPQGTGKTAFAEALAGEYGYNLLFVSGSELESKWVGESKDRLAKVYSRAKQLKPCIITLDEVDSFFETKGWTTHQKEQTGYLQSVLSKQEEGVYLIATTNNPHFLKDGMLDRFLYKLFFNTPSGKEQEAVWAKYLPCGIKPEEMMQAGISCRTIKNACQKAQTYGFPTQEAISNLIRNKQIKTDQYIELSKTIGDDVADYKTVYDATKNLEQWVDEQKKAGKL